MKKGTPITGKDIKIGNIYRLSDTKKYVIIAVRKIKIDDGTFCADILSSTFTNNNTNWSLDSINIIPITDPDYNYDYWYGEYIGSEETNPEYFL